MKHIDQIKFRSLNSLTHAVRKSGCPDYITFQGMLFTMEEYDMSGKEIYYGNRKHNKTMLVKTSNRYGQTKFKDAEIEVYDACSYRQDIHYAE